MATKAVDLLHCGKCGAALRELDRSLAGARAGGFLDFFLATRGGDLPRESVEQLLADLQLCLTCGMTTNAPPPEDVVVCRTCGAVSNLEDGGTINCGHVEGQREAGMV